jgi:hypothetical protein
LQLGVKVDLELVVFGSNTQVYDVRDYVVSIKLKVTHRHRSTLVSNDRVHRIEKRLDRVDWALDLEEIEPILKLWEDLVDWLVLVENPDLECASRVVDWGARVVDRDFEVSQGCNDVAALRE